ncbi:MAG: glucose-6-phosphate dehydrogenase [Acidobacteria bacterium]|nr:glucose-6-phosphate dehydrogenase [Acidobacteriota bacterium]
MSSEEPHANGSLKPDEQSDPCVMVIFGASGDLTKRKLIPSLYNLAKSHLLSRQFAVIGIARSEMSHEQFREKITSDMKEFATGDIDDDLWDWVQRRLYYMPGGFSDDATYQNLKTLLDQVGKEHGAHNNYFYYLATAPDYFGEIVKRLGAAGLATEDENTGWRRVIIEKPFGHDLESARALNVELKQVLHEKQIYRIDHYLGKETVQNILVFRFGNGIFEPIWNRRYIDHVQITAAESVGVESRGGYYETSGALRDMVPNHLFQLVTLTAMEPPISFEADAVRDEQSKILHAIQPMSDEEVLRRTIRGQYGDGTAKGERVPGYRQEASVNPNSGVETFVALKILIDNWRWADVPFYLRTGKRLPKRVTEVAIQFKRAPFVLFRDTGVEKLTPNRLVIHIQPDEGISMRFGAKVPGPIVKLGEVDMDFNYEDYFGKTTSTGYERLLYDCMAGDATLFQRADMVEAGWSVVNPILDIWKALPPRSFPNYAAGTWGPKEADELMERDGRRWRKSEADFSG